jgi:hypothetical protein
MIGNVTAFNTRLDNFLTEVVELSQNDGLPKTSHSDGVTAVDILTHGEGRSSQLHNQPGPIP